MWHDGSILSGVPLQAMSSVRRELQLRNLERRPILTPAPAFAVGPTLPMHFTSEIIFPSQSSRSF